ncbi:MAG: hypothetical protein COV43_02300 [Deltaproteobacteria bacterium CG11_big_fil_rev_8_21_14_0_20_42_23]|nr:MAG: hypothetical protein COV43_02300 [Deltaproteobacteria bacterium CG11_big_fil_rev_8_21_14_0_20_42_23]PJC64756.1 MAG: hypothetical protein CO021_02830 [Deltaproteobacteria bacterium CG_4_9_14_0_2_um_filter_42_21]
MKKWVFQGELVILDDETSIHQVWKSKFDVLRKDNPKEFSISHFSSGLELKKWYKNQNNGSERTLFLCDYELLGENENGVQIVEELGVHKQTILVSSRYEEPEVREKCKELGIKLIPKSLAGFVPIKLRASLKLLGQEVQPSDSQTINNEQRSMSILVIDDDEGIRLSWKVSKQRLGIEHLDTFASMEACEAEDLDYTKYSQAYVDKNIDGSTWTLAKTLCYLKEQGVGKIVIASGENSDDIRNDRFYFCRCCLCS